MLLCEVERQYMLTCKVGRYSLVALYGCTAKEGLCAFHPGAYSGFKHNTDHGKA